MYVPYCNSMVSTDGCTDRRVRMGFLACQNAALSNPESVLGHRGREWGSYLGADPQ